MGSVLDVTGSWREIQEYVRAILGFHGDRQDHQDYYTDCKGAI